MILPEALDTVTLNTCTLITCSVTNSLQSSKLIYNKLIFDIKIKFKKPFLLVIISSMELSNTRGVTA